MSDAKAPAQDPAAHARDLEARAMARRQARWEWLLEHEPALACFLYRWKLRGNGTVSIERLRKIGAAPG